MLRNIILSILVCLIHFTQANSKILFGINANLNVSKINISGDPIWMNNSLYHIGFAVGPSSKIDFSEKISLQTTILFSQKGSDWNDGIFGY